MKTLIISAALALCALVLAAPAASARAPHCAGWSAWAQRPHDVRLNAKVRSVTAMNCKHAADVVAAFLMKQVKDESCASDAAEGDGCTVRSYVCEKRDLERASCRLRGHVIRFRETDTDLG